MIRLRRIWTAKPLIIAYILVLGFTVGVLINRAPGEKAVPTLAGGQRDSRSDGHGEPPEVSFWLQLFRPSQPTARRLLRMGLPMLSVADGSAEAAERRTLRVHLVGQAGERPQTFFEVMLPFLRGDKEGQTAQETPTRPPESPGTPPDQAGPQPVSPPAPEPEQPVAVAGGQPVVGIYHTHDWESYISEFPAFSPKTRDDLDKIASENHARRTIMGVGQTLALKLKEKGVGTVYADYTHRELGYDYAYKVSRTTVKDILREYPTVKVLLDLHRDSGWGLDLTTTVGGKKAAQVRCIIGNKNPDYARNKAFCDQLMQRLEQKHPGLTQPTRVQGDMYNQDVIPGAILLEIGGALNQYAEADRSAGYLAEVLAEMIREGAYPK